MMKKCVTLFILFIFITAQVHAAVPQRVSTIGPLLNEETDKHIEEKIEKSAMGRRDFVKTGVKGLGALWVISNALLSACSDFDDVSPPIQEKKDPEVPQSTPGETISFQEATRRAREYVRFGVNQNLQFPYDVIALDEHGKIDEKESDHRTQPTLIGFYVQYLLDIITGNETDGVMELEEAEQNLKKLLTSLIQMQKDHGWKGLIPTWINIQSGFPIREDDVYTVGDNLNLAVKLFMIKGALGESDPLWMDAKIFLDKQEEGYAAMVDDVSGRFFGARVGDAGGRKSARAAIEKGQSIGYYRMINSRSMKTVPLGATALKSARTSDIIYDWQLDRVTSEFLPGIAWATMYYGSDSVPQTVFNKLLTHENDGVLSAFNGDMFTWTWATQTFDPTNIPTWQQIYRKYFSATMKESVKNGQIAVSDPGFHPYGGYMIGGRWRTSEGGFIVEGLGTAHGLAALSMNSPLYDETHRWIENILKVPGLVTSFGLPEGIIGNGTKENPYTATHVHTGVGKFAELLGSTDSQGNQYFLEALGNKQGDFVALYESLGNDLAGFGSSEPLPDPVDASGLSDVQWEISKRKYKIDDIPGNRDGFEWSRYQRDEEALHLRHFIVKYIKDKGWELKAPTDGSSYTNPIDHSSVRGVAEWYAGTDVLWDPVELRKRWMPENGKTKYQQFVEDIAAMPWIDYDPSSGGRTTGSILGALFARKSTVLPGKNVLLFDNDHFLTRPPVELSAEEMEAIIKGEKKMPSEYLLSKRNRIIIKQFLERGGVLTVISGGDVNNLALRISDLMPPRLRKQIIFAACGGKQLYGFDKNGDITMLEDFIKNKLQKELGEEGIEKFNESWENCVDMVIDKFMLDREDIEGVTLPRVRVDKRFNGIGYHNGSLSQVTFECDMRNNALYKMNFEKRRKIASSLNVTIAAINKEIREFKSSSKVVDCKEIDPLEVEKSIDMRVPIKTYLNYLHLRAKYYDKVPLDKLGLVPLGTGALDVGLDVISKQTAVKELIERGFIGRVLGEQVHGEKILCGEDKAGSLVHMFKGLQEAGTDSEVKYSGIINAGLASGVLAPEKVDTRKAKDDLKSFDVTIMPEKYYGNAIPEFVRNVYKDRSNRNTERFEVNIYKAA